MEDQVTGGANSDESSASTEKKEATKFIDPKDHQRALDDMMKYKKASQEVEALREEKRSWEQQQMKQKGLDKELAEKLEKELNKEREEKNRLKNSLIVNQKYEAVRAAAIKAGILPEAESDLEMLDLEDLSSELTTKGRVLVHGADEFMEKVKKTKPHWFKGGSEVKFNGGGTGGDKSETAPLTMKDIAALKYKDKKKYDEELAKYVSKQK